MAAETKGAPPVGLVGSLFDRVRSIIGDDAGYAMFHFAAFQEGQRIGASRRPEEAKEVVEHIDRILDQESELLDETPEHLVLRVHSQFASSENNVMVGIVLGMFEGALGAVHRMRYDGKASEDGQAGYARIELTKKVEEHGN